MVVQYQMPSDATLPTSPEGSSAPRSFAKPNEGMTRVVHDTGVGPVVRPVEGTGYNGPSNAKGILASAHDSVNAFVPLHEITDDTRVRVGNTSTTVKVAAKLGLIAKGPNGWYDLGGGNNGDDPKDPKGTPPAPQDAKDGSDTDDEANPRLDDESEAHVSEALNKAPGETIGVAEAFINAGGEVPEARLGQLASQLGIEPEVARERFEHVQAAYAAEAHNSLAETFGPELAKEAFEWAQTDIAAKMALTTKLREAASQHFRTGKPAYEAIGYEYVKHVAKTAPQRIVDGLEASGAKARIAPGGKIVFRGPDGIEREFVSSLLDKSPYVFPKGGLKKRK